ncbi:MAG TPA: class I SAM-dependent methyltransferase [bacterium]|nr:class I SAM-dependent methyltransferase [bacterium]
MFNWKEYINTTKNKPPRQLLVQALKYVKDKEVALDLGAGALNESKYLLEHGFKKVIAIDNEENLELISKINNKNFIFKKTAIEDYNFSENKFNLINAQFVLPFIKKEKINEVVSNIKNSLKNNGIFVGQFFGKNDSWSNATGICVYTEKEIKKFLTNLDIIYFQEEEKDGQTAMDGEKHWHIFHFIAKKY